MAFFCTFLTAFATCYNGCMNNAKRLPHQITWRGPESLYKRKNLLWYTHVSIGFVFMAGLLVLFQSWLGLVIATLLFVLFLLRANDKPKTITYTLDNTGITAGDRVIAYSDVDHFAVDKGHYRPVVVLELSQTFSMPVTLIVKPELYEEVTETLAHYVPYRENFSFMRWLLHALHY